MREALQEALCHAFCGALKVREVPVGYVVATGIKLVGGDALSFYVVRDKRDGARVRLEDDGQTVPLLEASGADLSAGLRAVAFAALLREAGASYDPDECVIHTPFGSMEAAARKALAFITLLIRMQDFMLVTREQVEQTFKEDVLRAVTGRFASRARITVDEPVAPDLWQTPADIVIRPDVAAPLALFLGTSNDRMLEAAVLHLKRANDPNPAYRVMLVLPSERPKRVRGRTRALATDDVPSTVFPGREKEALDDMEAYLFGGHEPSAVVIPARLN